MKHEIVIILLVFIYLKCLIYLFYVIIMCIQIFQVLLTLKALLNDCYLYLNNAKELTKTENFSYPFRIFST